MVKVRLPQPDGRGRMKRQWSVEKSAGPCVFAAEMVVKKLIQHSWPAVWVAAERRLKAVVAVDIVHAEGGETEAFFNAVSDAVAITARKTGAALCFAQGRLWLDGPHWIDEYGALRRGSEPPPF